MDAWRDLLAKNVSKSLKVVQNGSKRLKMIENDSKLIKINSTYFAANPQSPEYKPQTL